MGGRMTKIILYNAQTVNGYIAKENDDTPWSKEEWHSWYSTVKRARNVVIGRRTYELMQGTDAFKKCGNPTTIIVSKTTKLQTKNYVTFVKSPKAAVEYLKSKGFKEIIIGGGGNLNSSFVNNRLIDEIWLDIEPLFFKAGTKLFEKNKMDVRTKLIKLKKLSKNLIQIRYKVLK
jgi:dihydrofolate reductase